MGWRTQSKPSVVRLHQAAIDIKKNHNSVLKMVASDHGGNEPSDETRKAAKNLRLKAQLALVIDIALKVVFLIIFNGEAIGLRRGQ
jgi:hypothetical protein